jgi:hypothetical protein
MQELQRSIDECIREIEEELSDNVYDIFNKTIPLATQDALPTAEGWGAPRALGGLLWATYKATVKRNGV